MTDLRAENGQSYQAGSHIADTYRRFPIRIVSGHGMYVTDDCGKKYLDFTSGIGVNSLGYAHPDWVWRVSKQAATLAHISNLFDSQPMEEVADRLCELLHMDKVFFSNSGAEANECAIKIARKYGNQKKPGKNLIYSLQRSFHGRTLATLTATGQESFHQFFDPFPEGFVYLPPDDIGALGRIDTERAAAVLVEVVQGEGGVIELSPAYLHALQNYCRDHDILLMVDEVQTGCGRTGRFCAFQGCGLQPDVVTLAKGLGGGLPIGATVMGEKVKAVLGYGDHGSTFGGNPIACAGAMAVLEHLSKDRLQQISELSVRFRNRLAALPGVTEVTGLGLMIGLKLEEPLAATAVATACLSRGLLVLTAKDKLRLLPPLIIGDTEIERGLLILKKVLQKMQKQDES